MIEEPHDQKSVRRIKTHTGEGDTMLAEDRACRTLWIAVIHQALMDLVSKDESDDGILFHGESRRWFFMQSDSFSFVCAMAGLDPDAVRTRARAIETNPKLLGNPHV